MDMDNEFPSYVKTNETEINDEKSMTNLQGFNQDISFKPTVLTQPNTAMEINGNISTETYRLHEPLYTESNNTTDSLYPSAFSNAQPNSLQSTLTETKGSHEYGPAVNTFSELVGGSKSDGDCFKLENTEEVNLMNTSSTTCNMETDGAIQGDVLAEKQEQSFIGLPENIFPLVTDTDALNSRVFPNTENLTNRSEDDLNFSTDIKGVYGSYTETEVAPDFIHVSSPEITEFSKEPICERVEEPEENFKSFPTSVSSYEVVGNVESVIPLITEDTSIFPVGDLEGSLEIIEEKPGVISVDQFTLETETIEGDKILEERTNVEITEELDVQTATINNITVSEHIEIVKKGNAETDGNIVGTHKDNDSAVLFEKVDVQIEEVEVSASTKPIMTSVEESGTSYTIIPNETETSFPGQNLPSTEDNDLLENMEAVSLLEKNQTVVFQNEGMSLLEDKHDNIIDMTVKGETLLETIVNEPVEEISRASIGSPEILPELLIVQKENEVELTNFEAEENHVPPKKLTEIQSEEITAFSATDQNAMEIRTHLEAELFPNENIEVFSAKPNEATEVGSLELETNIIIEEVDRRERKPEDIVSSELKQVPVAITEYNPPQSTGVLMSNIKDSSATDQNAMETRTHIEDEVSPNENIKTSSTKPKKATKDDSNEIEMNVKTKEADRRQRKPEEIVSNETKQIPEVITEHKRPKSTGVLMSDRGKSKREMKMKKSRVAIDRGTEILKIVQNKSNTYKDGIYVHPTHRAYATEIKDGNINLLKYTRLSDGQLSDNSNNYEYLKSFRMQNGNDYINMKINGRKRRKMVGRFIYECCNKITLLENITINYIDGNKQNQNPSNLSIQIDFGGEKNKKETK